MAWRASAARSLSSKRTGLQEDRAPFMWQPEGREEPEEPSLGQVREQVSYRRSLMCVKCTQTLVVLGVETATLKHQPEKKKHWHLISCTYWSVSTISTLLIKGEGHNTAPTNPAAQNGNTIFRTSISVPAWCGWFETRPWSMQRQAGRPCDQQIHVPGLQQEPKPASDI